METLNQALSLLLISLFTTMIWAPVLIKFLYKFNFIVKRRLMPNKINEEFIRIQGHKAGTPNMGGLMISINVTLVTLILVPYSPIRTIFLFGWLFSLIYGLLDGLLTYYTRRTNDKIRLLIDSFSWRVGKLGLLYFFNLLVLLIIHNVLEIKSLSFFSLFEIEFTVVSILFGALFMALAMYGMEITDGADGLVTGQFLIALLSLGVICFLNANTSVLSLIAIIIGSCLVYLYFNINPARVFMGGTGTFPIGFALLFFSIVLNVVDIFIVIGLVFWVELFSSGIQLLSLKFLKRKVFKIAPLHHHFEAIGWSEPKMVQRFWLMSMVFTIIALWLFST